MGILEAYDSIGTPVITPDKIYKKMERRSDTCIVTFSSAVLRSVLERFEYEEAGQAATANGPIIIYYLPVHDVFFLMSPIGAPAAASTLHDVQYMGDVRNFICFGSCGLIDDKARDKIIVPTSAYREEGFSYHFAAPSDYIDIENHDPVRKVLAQHNVPFICGKTWTTDAFYMETDRKVRQRKDEGCLCVEMESSALQAVCSYLGVDLYTFFFTGDVVGDDWDRADLGGHREQDKQLFCFDLALKIADYVKKQTAAKQN